MQSHGPYTCPLHGIGKWIANDRECLMNNDVTAILSSAPDFIARNVVIGRLTCSVHITTTVFKRLMDNNQLPSSRAEHLSENVVLASGHLPNALRVKTTPCNTALLPCGATATMLVRYVAATSAAREVDVYSCPHRRHLQRQRPEAVRPTTSTACHVIAGHRPQDLSRS